MTKFYSAVQKRPKGTEQPKKGSGAELALKEFMHGEAQNLQARSDYN